MRNYEIMFIVKTTISEDEIKKVIENFGNILTTNGAKIISTKDMGQRELAYEINKFTTGYYFLYVVEANAETVKEFDRIVRINESLLRHLIVKVED